MTNEQHNKYIAYTFLGYAGFQLLMLLLIAGMFSMFFFVTPDPRQPEPPRVFAILFGFMAIFQLLFTAPGVIAAYALLKRKSWARMASIVAGVVSAMHVPFGTAACVYSLWFFLGENWKTVYAPAAGLNQISEPVSQWESYQRDEHGDRVYRNVEPPDWR